MHLWTRLMLDRKVMHQIARVRGASERPEAASKRRMSVKDLPLRDDIKAASSGNEGSDLGEWLRSSCGLRSGLARTFGDGIELAAVACQQSDDAVIVSEVASPQDDPLRRVGLHLPSGPGRSSERCSQFTEPTKPRRHRTAVAQNGHQRTPDHDAIGHQ